LPFPLTVLYLSTSIYWACHTLVAESELPRALPSFS